MKFVLISDLHEKLPDVDSFPQVDAILFGGDFAFQERWNWNAERVVWKELYAPWLARIKDRGIDTIAVAGNHDSIGCAHPNYLVPFFDHYLEETSIDYKGLSIYGSPWTLPYKDWAFAKDEEGQQEQLTRLGRYDVIINHGPPYGILDDVGNENTGSKALLNYCHRTKPKLVMFGHIHQGYGHVIRDGVNYVNCSWVDLSYRTRKHFITWDSETNLVGLIDVN